VLARSEWIFVDDGSHDETAEVLDAWIRRNGFEWTLKVLRLKPNRGKGGAVQAGDAESRGEIRCFLDADLSTPLEKILPAFERFVAEKDDLMIGSRHAVGAVLAEKQPWHRILLGRLFSYFCSLFHANAFTDTQCGFKLWNESFSADVVQKLEEKRWAFDLEMILRGEAAGKSIVEEPVTWTDKEGSKVSALRDGLKMLGATLRFRAKYGSPLVWILAAILLGACFSMALRWSNDMSTYAIAWERVRTGRFGELYEIAREGQGGYYYSPLFALLGAPLSLFSTSALRFVYALITLLIGLSGWVILKRCVRETGVKLSARAAPWLLLMLLMSNNVVGQFQTANISLWVLSFTLFALYKSLHGKTGTAAFWLALAVNFKVFPAFMLLYFFWMRDIRFFVFFGLWSLAMLAAPALYFGWDANLLLHQQQIEMLKVYGPQNDFGREAYQSVSALLVRLSRDAWLGNLGESLLMKIAQLSVVAVSGIFLLAYRPRVAKRSEKAATFFFLMAMMGLFSPASWVNSMGYCYFPAFAVTAMLSWGPNSVLREGMGRARARWVATLTGIFFVAYALTTQGIVGRTINDLLEKASVPTYGIFALVAAFWIAALGIKRSGAAADFSR
jgi:dolichyl-phosphate beta-glucosyltransferase